MNDLKDICRICFLKPKEGPLTPIDDDLIKQMLSRAGIMLSHPTHCQWPECVCSECVDLIKAASRLRMLCQQSEKHLQLMEEAVIDNANMEEQMQELKEDAAKPPMKVLNGKCLMKLSVEKRRIYEIDLKISKTTPEESFDFISISPSNSSTPLISDCFKCDICNNVYTERMKFTAHLKMHSQDKPHQCEICHKRFRQTPQLTRHMNSHTGQRPYKCNYCDSSFGDPSTRYKHQRIHTNERPYKCIYCDKSFNYSNVLDVHLKTHTGERPYSCGYCGQRFSQLHHKNSHEKGHINNKPDCLED
ncbi:zinc finger protein 253 [Drosophila tropicalis]|uniref:zinc finger protein 253 n=1 Tax=Drosophila tropicalis TaxID=46794 RepID=UPI0035ABB979